jgi:hypothetical protein
MPKAVRSFTVSDRFNTRPVASFSADSWSISLSGLVRHNVRLSIVKF